MLLQLILTLSHSEFIIKEFTIFYIFKIFIPNTYREINCDEKTIHKFSVWTGTNLNQCYAKALFFLFWEQFLFCLMLEWFQNVFNMRRKIGSVCALYKMTKGCSLCPMFHFYNHLLPTLKSQEKAWCVNSFREDFSDKEVG